MKALTNILTRLLMLMLLMLVACTEETVEVNNLMRQEQYVTVRMNIPGMTATATRAADGVIESITALAFDDADKLLEIETITTVTNTNANNGFNGTFNLTVPNGTTTIHFLANLPGDVTLPTEMGGNEIDVMTSLTTGDYNNLCYWGMTTTRDGNTNPLNVTFYRNLAKISIKPSETDTEFNQFEQYQLIIAGLINPNRVGWLVPYNNSAFFQGGNAPSYHTLPDYPNPLNVTPIGNEGADYGNSLYVFEHENSNYKEYGLFVICKIDDYFYNVALTSDGINPYPIIRNHEYIIYVSDVDDYQTDEYRSNNYSEMYDAETSTMLKTPINLVVKQVAQVAFSNTSEKTIDWNNGYPNSFNVDMTNITDGTVTLSIAAEGFSVTQGGNELQKVEGNYTYTGGNATFTFTPTTIGQHTITINGTGTYTSVPTTTINVNVTASIKAQADKTQLYYDSNESQTVTLNVTVPSGVETLSITAEDFEFSGDNDGEYSYDVNGQTNAALTFTLKSGITEDKTSTITISDASGNATQYSVSVSLIPTPGVTFSPNTDQTINVDGYLDIQMTGNNIPNNSAVTLSITAPGFTVSAHNSTPLIQNDDVWTYTGTITNFRFTPSSAGTKPIKISGEGVDINVTPADFIVTVNATITATESPSTIYYDGNNKTTTVSVIIPKGVTGLSIEADDFTVKQGETSLTYDETKGAYTYDRDDATTQVDVDFVFTLKDDVTTAKTSTITFSDASDNEYVEDAEVVIDVEATPVVTNTLTVTPITSTTIDLSGSGNNTVQLTLAIPSDLNYLKINTNYAFTVSALNDYTQPRAQAPYYYYDYIQPGSVNTIDLEFTMNADYIFEVAGQYPITFYAAQNSSEGITTTIMVVNENLDDGVIWEGSKTATVSGYILKYTSFSEYRDSGKQLKIDVTSTSDSNVWKQFYIKYEGDNNNLGTLQGHTIDSTLSIDIPSQDKDLIISGEGGITITKIYIE